MRRALLVGGVLLAAVVVFLLLVPVLFKDRIVAAIVAEVEGAVDADVALADADVSLVRSFPDLHVSLDGLAVTGRGAFAGVELAKIGHLGLGVDLASVLGGGAIEITALSLADARVHVVVDESGRMNTDLAPAEAPAAAPADAPAASAPEDASGTALRLQDVDLADVSLRYEDRQGGLDLVVEGLDLRGHADVTDALYATVLDASADAVSYTDGGATLLKRVKLATKLDARYAADTGRIDLGESSLSLNELALAFSGSVVPEPGGTALDVAFSAPSSTFRSVLSLVPDAYGASFAGVEAAGAFTLKGAVKGLLPDEGDALPGFELAMSIADGSFRYPDLSAGLSDVQLDLAVRHPGGAADLVEVDLPRFHLAVDGSPLDGRLSLRHPETDPTIDTRVVGKLDLGKLAAAFPADVVGWTGQLDVDLDLAGASSAFEAMELDKVRAAGHFRLTDATWTDASLPMPIRIESLDLGVDPRKVGLAELRARFGDSDLAATGELDNVLGYVLADEALSGRVDARATMLDLNPWAGGDEAEGGAAPSGQAAPEAESAIVPVPRNLDLAVSVAFAQVLYDDWDLRDVRGAVVVKDGVARLDDLRARALGGELAISGTYAAPTAASADVDLDIRATDLGAAETVLKLSTLEAILPAAKTATGRLSTGFAFRSTLKQDLTPDLATIVSKGRFGAVGLEVAPTFLAPIAAATGNDEMRKLVLGAADVGFDIEGGKLRVDRVPFTLGGAKGELRGRTGLLDEGLDLRLDLAVPAASLKGGELAGKLAPGGTVDLVADIGGTWKDPKVKVDLGGATKDAVVGAAKEQVAAVVDDVVAAARQKGDALVAEAEKAGDRLRSEADKAGDALRAEAKKQGAKLAKEAKGNPIAEAAARKAADKLEKEADAKADKLEKEADKQADAGVAAARKERDQLVAEAEKQAKKAR